MLTKVLLFSTLIIGLYTYNSRKPARDVKIWQKPSQDSLSKIDSLKWIMYAMNYYKKVYHFRHNNLPELNILECDIQYNGPVNNKKDTTIYTFYFFKDSASNIYSPDNIYFSGIGYSYKAHNYYPVLAHAYATFAENTDTAILFLKKRDEDFRTYLKTYPGNLSHWLKDEAIRRKILSPNK
ncbi:MAG: hypothetical protein WDO16_26145 [Bacteroidota bacterium]